MKKLVAVGLVAVMAVAMSGCGDKISLTTEQNDLIAEYVAGTMLKYSYDNEWKYTKLKAAQNTYVPSSQKATQSPTIGTSGSTSSTQATTKASGSTSGSGTAGGSGVSTDPLTGMSSSLGLSDVKISYKGVTVGSSYPADALAIAVPAMSGYQVAAVEFTLTNETGSSMTLNTTSSTVNMKLTISGNSVTQSTSILKNDINGLKNITLDAGASYTAVAIFQVEESIADQVSGSTLTINAGSASLGTLTVK